LEQLESMPGKAKACEGMWCLDVQHCSGGLMEHFMAAASGAVLGSCARHLDTLCCPWRVGELAGHC